MSEKPRICLIYTGGTIGMVETSDGLRPPEKPSDFLKIAPELEEFVEIDFVPLLNKDSTNMNPSDWEKMARAVHERRNDRYEGFVIAHGTDTMHFSASALAFALGRNLNFPVVFTGAQTIPKVLHGDARINLVRACRVALESLAEVVISFGDFVFRGCRAQKKDERKFDAFESPAFPPLAYITETIDLQRPIPREKKDDGRKEIEFRPHFEKGILQVALIPILFGMIFAYIILV
ncbi:MAG: asparaginase [Candidatus Omnitrophica bacterium]|nr:asparaginase [Candidatus Omnitrophota bacterium]